MVDNLTPQQRQRNMSNIKSRDTVPEKIVRSILHKLGFRFRLHSKKLPGKPDIILPRHHKIILVHGCFWHKHNCKRGNVTPRTNDEYWAVKRQRNVQRDEPNKLMYQEKGWTSLILWECETKDRNTLTERLLNFLKL